MSAREFSYHTHLLGGLRDNRLCHRDQCVLYQTPGAIAASAAAAAAASAMCRMGSATVLDIYFNVGNSFVQLPPPSSPCSASGRRYWQFHTKELTVGNN